MKNARSVFVTALVLIGVVIGVGVWKGAIPPKFGTEGAIGAAKRYSSQQITDSDVRLGDGSIQSFIQSDLFHAIATNPDFQKVLKSDACKNGVKVDNMLDVVADSRKAGHGQQDFSQLVASTDFQQMTASADFKKAIRDPKVQNLLANEDFQKWSATEDFKSYIADAQKGKNQDASKGVVKDAKSAEYKALTANADMKEALSNADFIAAAANTDMAKVIKENQKWLANQDFMTLLANEDFQTLVASEDYQNLVASEEFQHLVANEDFQKIAKNQDFQKWLKEDYAAVVAASEDMQKNKAQDQ